MSSLFCPFPQSSELKMSSRILNYPPNRSLPHGKQWKSVFGVFTVDEGLNHASETVSNDNDSKGIMINKKLVCIETPDVLKKTVYCCALGVQGISSEIFSENKALPHLPYKISDRKVLLEIRETFLTRVLLNAAMNCFLKSDDAVLIAFGCAIRRVVDLSDHSIATTSTKLLRQCTDKEVSLFSFWSSCKSEAVVIRILFQSIAPAPLLLASQSKSFCSYMINANNVIDEYFQPSGWSGLSSDHHKWNLFNSLIVHFTASRRLLWSSCCSSKLSLYSIFTNAPDLRLNQKLNRGFLSMVTHGHMLKSIATPLLQPLSLQLFLLQLASDHNDEVPDVAWFLNSLEVQEGGFSVSSAFLSVSDLFSGSGPTELEALVQSVQAWSQLRVMALLQPCVSSDVRVLTSRLKHFLSREAQIADTAIFASQHQLLFIPTSNGEVDQLHRLLSFSSETVNHFAGLVEPLVRGWAELEQQLDRYEGGPERIVTSDRPSAWERSNGKTTAGNGTSDSSGDRAGGAAAVDPSVDDSKNKDGMSQSTKKEFAEIPLLVGSAAAVDQSALDRAMQALRESYALKFLKAETQRDLFRWRTMRSQRMKDSRAALREMMRLEEEQLRQMRVLREADPAVFQQRMEQGIQEDKKRLVLLQLQRSVRRGEQLGESSRQEEDGAIVAEVPIVGVIAGGNSHEGVSEEEVKQLQKEDARENKEAVLTVTSEPTSVVTGEGQIDSEPAAEKKEKGDRDTEDNKAEDAGALAQTEDANRAEGVSDIEVRDGDLKGAVSGSPAGIEGTAVPSKVPPVESIVLKPSDDVSLTQSSVLPHLSSSAFLDIGQPLLFPDLSWITSEEAMLAQTLSSHSKSMEMLALHSKLVEDNANREDSNDVKPGSKSIYGPGLTSSEGILLRCIQAQCCALNLASLHSAISVSGVLDQLRAVEDVCLLSPQSDFLTRLCSHMVESCVALGPAQVQSRQLTSVWNEESLSTSFAVCLEQLKQVQSHQWRATSLGFELSQQGVASGDEGTGRAFYKSRSRDSFLSPVWLCASDGAIRIRIIRLDAREKQQTTSTKTSSSAGCGVVSRLVLSDPVLEGICCMTIRCLEVSQLKELLRLVWLKMKDDRQPTQQLQKKSKEVQRKSNITNSSSSTARRSEAEEVASSAASQYRSGLLLVQHLVRGVMAYLTERIIAARAALRQRLVRSVEGAVGEGGLESLVLAVRGFAEQLCQSALLEEQLPLCNHGPFSDDMKGLCGDLSLLLRGCRLLLGHLLCNDVTNFHDCYAELQRRLASLQESLSVCTLDKPSSHLNSLISYLL